MHERHHLHVQSLDHLEESELSTCIFPIFLGKPMQFSKARISLALQSPTRFLGTSEAESLQNFKD